MNQEGNNPVVENVVSLEWILEYDGAREIPSESGTISKAKYSLVTDSEPVP